MQSRYKEDSRFTQDYIKGLIEYNPDSGKAKWKERVLGKDLSGAERRGITAFNSARSGNDIVTVDSRGYIVTSILGLKIALHRLIFIYMEGKEPVCCDHINGVRTDNKWSNLRAVTLYENKQNVKRDQGVVKYTGVTKIRRVDGSYNYRAKIRVDGKSKQLGMFDTPEQAAIAYNEAIDKYRNGFGRKNVILSEST